MPTMPRFHVKEIWRYPVKSMQGERMEQCVLREDGIPFDRGWALRDETRQQITGAKRLAGILNCSARYLPQTSATTVPHVEITLPSGRKTRSDAPDVNGDLSDALGAKVTLWPLQPREDKKHYRQKRAPSENPLDELKRVFGLKPEEPLPDLSKFPGELIAELTEFVAPLGTYFDAYPVDVLSEASLRHLKKFAPNSTLDVRRFRPNFLVADDGDLDEPIEQEWIDSEIGIGEARLAVALAAPRCIMTTRPQPGLSQDNAVLRAIIAEMKHCLSVYCRVVRPGTVRVGDVLSV
jgi:MOSC domain-containing protein